MATLSLPLPLPLPLPPWRAHGHAPWQKGPRSCAMHRTVPCLGASYRGIQPLYDDGYQTWRDLDEYYTALGELAEHDSGAPCWFCPAGAGPPVAGAPAMLYLPGAEGMGLGLLMHHKALGSIFELRCMHIPFRDRTPFEGLVAFVEDELRSEHGNSPHKPIYLLGNSFGGCLALAVAARNPNMDLVLVLVNPATSFEQSDIQHLLSVFRFLSDRASITITNLLNYNIDNEVNMVMSSMKSGTPPLEALNMLSNNLSSFLKHSDMLDMVPSDTLMWKVRLLKSASSYANRRLQAVTAEVLLLISCADKLLPSKTEAERLQKMLPQCKVFYFENHGHSLLLEYGVHVSSIIKCTNLYRHSRNYNRLSDYIPPSATELMEVDKASSDLRRATSPVMLSTRADGAVVRGLGAVPAERGAVLLVGNHMLLGVEMISLAAEFLRQRRAVVRGIAHPLLFPDKRQSGSRGHDFFDFLNLWGGVPLSSRHIYDLLADGQLVLLYPGGHREALHCKGEEHRLFWPAHTEFVRMAAQFAATIVPFGVVGEDDVAELICSFEDIENAPFGKEVIKAYSRHLKLRDDDSEVFFPGVFPKLPGRFYYLFGKPIPTRDRKDVLVDRKAADAMYLDVKSEVERIISYLLAKREEDMYRCVLARSLYTAARGPNCEVPTFKL